MSDQIQRQGKMSPLRRGNKPLIEKRRRARINDCLTQLKTLVMAATNTQVTRPSKLEKADILEMTVDYLKSIPVRTEDDDLTKSNIGYNTGYVACSKEISRFLSSVCDIPDDIKAKMINHLLKQSSPSRERIPEDTIKTEKVEIKDSSYSQSESPPIVSSTSDSSMEPLKVQCGDGVIIVVQLSKAERTIEAVHLVDTNMKPNTSLATPLLIHAQPIWHATDQGLLTIASVRPQSNDYCPSLAADSANASLMAPVSTQSGVIDLAESSNAQCVNSLPCCDGAVWRPW